MIVQVSPLATVKLDGSGNGQCAIGPPSATRWSLRLATLAVSTSAKQPQGFLYRGSASGPIELIDSTYTGASASSGKVGGAPYYPGQQLWAVWKGGDVGATATLQAYGQQGSRSDPFEPGPFGEGFANPVVAGTALVIPAINSPNFVAGSTGWTINQDGTAEFNAAVIRGELDLGVAPNRIVLGPVIPPELTAYYNVGLAHITSAIVWYYGNATNTYHYYAVVDLGAGVPPGQVVRGDVLSGTVIPLDSYQGADYGIQRTASFQNGIYVASPGLIDNGASRSVQGSQTTPSTTASAAYVAPTNLCGTIFTLPTVGAALIMYSGYLSNNTVGGETRVSPVVRTGNVIGAGTVVTPASDSRSINFAQPGIANQAGSKTGFVRIAGGLIGGSVYNVSLEFRAVSGGTSQIDDLLVAAIFPN